LRLWAHPEGDNCYTITTLGKELQDLDDAYKKRLLSEKEYKEARKNLMKKYND